MIDPRRAALPRFFSGNVNRRNDMASQFFRTKNPDHLMRDAAAPERQMKRSLGAFDLTCIGIGALIGSGIFAVIAPARGVLIFFALGGTAVLDLLQSRFSGELIRLHRVR